MKFSNKTLEDSSLALIPLGLVSIYLIKSMILALALLFVGLLMQVQLYRNHAGENRGKEFLRSKLGVAIVSLVVVVYFVIKYLYIR